MGSTKRAFTRSAPALTSAVTTAALLCVCAPVARADAAAPEERRLVNRMDGSRLALLSDGTGEGAPAITLRAPSWQYKTVKWTNTYKPDGSMVIKNVAAGKCLQPATANPQAGDGLVVKTCDGTAAQDWTYRWEQTDGNTGVTAWPAVVLPQHAGVAEALDGLDGVPAHRVAQGAH
ncbi:RICIN domain-containing protein, partial [Sphaerisporangium sp. NPDC049002]|uniref:RICIN domain-containing protein n=1 Tax=Sphaerisporangium sp. NPDC049002 TaxID=3155392 RepID=UPI0033FF7725